MDWWIMLTFMCLILAPKAISQTTGTTTTSLATTTTTAATTTTTSLPTTTTTAGTTTTTSPATTTTTAGTTTTTSPPTTTTTTATTTTTSSSTTTTTSGTTTTTSSPTTTTTSGTTTTTSSPTTTTTSGTTTTTSSPTTTTTSGTTTTTSSPTTTTTSGTTTTTNSTANTTTSGTTTTTNSTANTTTTGTTTITTTVAPAATFSLSFKILQTFVPALSNSSSPEFISLAKNITDQVTPIYKAKFKNFLRIRILSFKNGSIDTNSELSFSSSTNANNVISAFNESLSNFTFQVDPASLSVKETTPTTTTASPISQVFSLIFSINSTFFAALADTSSSLFAAYASNITSQIEPLYRTAYSNFARMQILTFSNGSTVVQSLLFINSNGSDVNVTSIRNTLINGLNSLNFTVLSNSVTVTQTFGNSMSPVIGSPLSMMWMSLLSLLLTVALRH
ncbi:uncharacterized protein LOC128514258 [Clarias gariepinus]|uniref:uncharacterized protein LOC128514258 n=1 Tax=Clarias gariepinus TaxID=13013 RepID=UPI00234D263D|nr:uncharacterized protein LOC128514258 [Clarias gariepinus]